MDGKTELLPEEKEYIEINAFFYLKHEKWEKAFALYEALSEIEPENPRFLKGMAIAGFHLGQFERVLSLIDKWIAQVTNHHERRWATIFKARTLWAMGREEEARNCAKQVI